MFLFYFANRNEILRDSSRIELVPPNIRNDIVSESGLTCRTSQLEKKKYETSRFPPNRKKSIRGDSGDSWPGWNRGIRFFDYLRIHAIYEGGIKSNTTNNVK